MVPRTLSGGLHLTWVPPTSMTRIFMVLLRKATYGSASSRCAWIVEGQALPETVEKARGGGRWPCFAKKENWEQKVAAEVGGPAPVPAQALAQAPAKRGAAVLKIRDRRDDPAGCARCRADQNVELVVRVVARHVGVAEPCGFAGDHRRRDQRCEKAVRERIADFHNEERRAGETAGRTASRSRLAGGLAIRRGSTEVKERLQLAEGSAPGPAQMPGAVSIAADKLPITTMIGTSSRWISRRKPRTLPTATA